MKRLSKVMSICAVATLAACGQGAIEEEDGTMGANVGGQDSYAITAPICPGSSKIQGIDVSVWQGSIDWSAVRRSGRSWAFARVGYGSTADSTFSGNWSRMKSAGVLRGAYLYFLPNRDPAAQARLVISKVGVLRAGDLPVMADVEYTGGMSASTVASRLATFVNAVAKGTGKKPLIYTGSYFWDDNVRSSAFASYGLVIPAYGVTCPHLPNAWRSFKAHQYSDKGRVSGISGAVDLDYFNGTLTQLKALAGIVAQPASCDRRVGPFGWSCNGTTSGMSCVKIAEPADPHTWTDNYFCSTTNLGIRWSYAGPIAGMRCTQIVEAADPNTWKDNYLCVPTTSTYRFSWSSAGPISGKSCIQWLEPADPNTWKDNYLCW